MKKLMDFLLVLLMISGLFSCSSSKSQNDSDIIPDSDSDDSESIADDDTDSEQDSDFIDDSDETPDSDINADSENNDADSDIEAPEEPDDGIFEETAPINGYARCYDKIPAGDYEGFFADPNIEYWIKISLDKDVDYELAEEDLKKVTNLSMFSQDIRGIEKLINLQYLRIRGKNVYDFTPLLKLEKLKKIRIDGENMDCLDGSFSLLTTLETVEIDGTKFTDVSPVEQLENLISLHVNDSLVEFLPEQIRNLQKLELLSFSHNNLKNIDEVKSLTNLKRLFFHYNSVEDISPIKELINLTRFGAQGNKIKDISAVTNLVNLTYLGLNENQIKEIPKEITNLKKLQNLELKFNNISNLPNLTGLDSLVIMEISFNDLSNEYVVKLDDLENVKFLYVTSNKRITQVPVMKNLKSLQELYLNYNSITDLSGFADNESFPALKSVYLGSNKITDAEALRKREGLSRLSIGNNCIQDLSPLEELKERGTYISGMNEQQESCEDK